MENYLRRTIDLELEKWALQSSRKPLLIRGARQVGKSTAVRVLGGNQIFENFVEINFDSSDDFSLVFENNTTVEHICEDLSLLTGSNIIAGKTLLFLDEIQQCPTAIKKLRYFYEQMPDLHVVAAGSLLEFALEGLQSYGVGRIRSLFVYPFSFKEFLLALNEDLLVKAIDKADSKKSFSEPVHNKLLFLLKRFFIIGGMPEVVSSFVQKKDINECMRVLDDLIISFKDDFSKYKARVPENRISEVFNSAIQSSGSQFKYKDAANANILQIKEALSLLVKAGLLIEVTHTAANGIPLGAEINIKRKKIIPIDTALYLRLLNLDLSEIILSDTNELVNKGALAEIYVGLELLKASSCYKKQDLFFWKREAKSSNAELDYVVQKNESIIPIEVKAGTRGSMQSLHLFMQEKQVSCGIRCSSENFSVFDNIRVVPLYAIRVLFE